MDHILVVGRMAAARLKRCAVAPSDASDRELSNFRRKTIAADRLVAVRLRERSVPHSFKARRNFQREVSRAFLPPAPHFRANSSSTGAVVSVWNSTPGVDRHIASGRLERLARRTSKSLR